MIKTLHKILKKNRTKLIYYQNKKLKMAEIEELKRKKESLQRDRFISKTFIFP